MIHGLLWLCCSEIEARKAGAKGRVIVDDPRKYPAKENLGPLSKYTSALPICCGCYQCPICSAYAACHDTTTSGQTTPCALHAMLHHLQCLDAQLCTEFCVATPYHVATSLA